MYLNKRQFIDKEVLFLLFVFPKFKLLTTQTLKIIMFKKNVKDKKKNWKFGKEKSRFIMPRERETSIYHATTKCQKQILTFLALSSLFGVFYDPSDSFIISID
jgi:hypothetical protein